ncbi:hypothetical protein NE237_003710 [Protea cynaroides]|uniref:Uncharacterized protein n=1 Tax=Protea cynaroides TaxID=273540 RepID=A0A9Q0KHX6_9MAGN|nr:hypothetical protein NE237_003710 [Protea cynaroides]
MVDCLLRNKVSWCYGQAWIAPSYLTQIQWHITLYFNEGNGIVDLLSRRVALIEIHPSIEPELVVEPSSSTTVNPPASTEEPVVFPIIDIPEDDDDDQVTVMETPCYSNSSLEEEQDYFRGTEDDLSR